MSNKMINIGGDDEDLNYRYKMPTLQTKSEGRGAGIKTVLINIAYVSKCLHTEPSYVTKYFGMEVGALSNYDREQKVGIVSGVHQAKELQLMLKKYIKEIILCPKCKLPELQFKIHKKKKVLLQKCASCGWKGINSSNHKVKTYIIKHPPIKDKHYKWQKERQFLRACNNFKTIGENFELLLYGLIRENTQKQDVYDVFPMDIMYLIFAICYNNNDCEYFEEVKDTFDSDHIDEWNKYDKIFKLNQSKNIIRMLKECANPQTVYGQYIITNELIRKIWRIKVLKNYSENKRFNFRIGIVRCDSDESMKCEFIANETVIDDDGYYYCSNIKEEDIISILFIHDITKRADALIQFAINDIIYPKQFDTTNVNLHNKKYKLAIKMSQMEELQLLQ